MSSYISISEMAKLHGITRQTLIHYDNIDLFKPAKVDANGYRYYCKYQIPYLREICFLKSLGIRLKDIQQHFQERTPENEMYLLEEQKEYIMNQIAKLNTLREYINQRIDVYEEAVDAGKMRMSLPFVRYIDARQAIFKEWLQPIDKDNLHTTLMDLWQRIFEREMVPSGAFGSIIKKSGVKKNKWLQGAGSCIFLPGWNKEHENILTIPDGEYVCMYKYGMPYDTEHLEKLMQWLAKNNYELAGRRLMQMVTLSVGHEPYTVTACVVLCGKDIAVVIGGGEASHIGAAVMASSRPSLKNSAETSASASVLCRSGHKDEFACQGGSFASGE